MLRELGERDRDTILEYAGKEPTVNLFLIADLQTHGFDPAVQQLWGDFDSHGLRALLLRHQKNCVLYSASTIHDTEAVTKVLKTLEYKMLLGAKPTVQPHTNLQSFQVVTEQELAELSQATFRGCPSTVVSVERALPADAGGLCALRAKVPEFSPRTEASIRAGLESGRTRTLVIRKDRTVVATVCTIAECDGLAMIGGVMTHPDYRGRGYASACLAALCSELLAEGKTCGLTFDNPAAAHVYHKLGFNKVCDWLMCRR